MHISARGQQHTDQATIASNLSAEIIRGEIQGDDGQAFLRRDGGRPDQQEAEKQEADNCFSYVFLILGVFTPVKALAAKAVEDAFRLVQQETMVGKRCCSNCFIDSQASAAICPQPEQRMDMWLDCAAC